MHELTLEQAEIIARFVKRHQIVFSHLYEDLVDHLCCDLEESIRNGSNFEVAFSDLKQRLGGKRLTNIQEDTLYAVDLKYRKMKKLMKISGVAGTVILGLSTVFKIQHLPGAGQMITLGALILIILFLPSSLMVLWKESKSGRRLFLFTSAFFASALFIAGVIFKIQHWPGSAIVLTLGILIAILLFLPTVVSKVINNTDRTIPGWIFISGAIMVALYAAGFLCKIMHWPGASFLLITGIALLVGLVIPAYTYHRWKDADSVSLEAVFIIFLGVMFIVPSVMISLDTSKNFERFFVATAALDNRNLEYRVSRNEDLVSSYDFNEVPEMAGLISITADIMADIDGIENKVLSSFGEKKLEFYKGEGNLQDQIFNYDNTRNVFETEEVLLTKLKTDLEQYTGMIKNLNMSYPETYQSALLDLDTYIPAPGLPGEELNWLAPIVLVQSLETLKGAILDAEAFTLRSFAGKLNNSN